MGTLITLWYRDHDRRSDCSQLVPIEFKSGPSYVKHTILTKKTLNGYQCGIAMASSGNINRGIQLIIDAIDCNMLKGKYLIGTLSAHPVRLHN